MDGPGSLGVLAVNTQSLVWDRRGTLTAPVVPRAESEREAFSILDKADYTSTGQEGQAAHAEAGFKQRVGSFVSTQGLIPSRPSEASTKA